MGRVQGSNTARRDVAEIDPAGQQQVGSAPLVCTLVIALVTGAARQEEPPLKPLAPYCRFMDKVACSRPTKHRHSKKESMRVTEVRTVATWWFDPRSAPQGIVVGQPVLMLNVTIVTDDFHPLRVMVDHLASGGGPLLAKTSNV